MRIHCLTTFLHGRDRFATGETRVVSDEDGAYFVQHGWAEDLGGDVPTGDAAEGPTDLSVDSSTIDSGDSHG